MGNMVYIRRNAKLKEAMTKAIISREVHIAWKKSQNIMSNLDKGLTCIQRWQELAIPTEYEEERLAQRLGRFEDGHK